MGNIDYIKALIELVESNPGTAAAIGGAVLAVVGFFKPVALALRARWIARINDKWPDEGGHEERVRKTVDELAKTRFPVPRAYRNVIENSVRSHKSTPPPVSPSDESE